MARGFACAGTVYGAALNFRDTLEILGDAVNAAPYNQPPRGPVLYVKTPNTFSADGDSIVVPEGCDALEMGGTIGLVFGRAASRLSTDAWPRYVRGLIVVNDVCVPHASYFRPAIAQRCRDGFCPMGSEAADLGVLTRGQGADIRILVDDTLACTANTRNLVRSVGQLVADVTSFMTLADGDVLLVGIPGNAPQAKAGQRVRIEVDGLGSIENALVGTASPVASGA